jgi:hypothetical protein
MNKLNSYVIFREAERRLSEKAGNRPFQTLLSESLEGLKISNIFVVLINFTLMQKSIMKCFYHLRRAFSLLLAAGMTCAVQAQKSVELIAPDGAIKLSVTLGDRIGCSISVRDEVLLSNSSMQLRLRNKTLGKNPKLAGQKRTSVDTEFKPVVPFKFSTVKNRYNQLLLNFRGGYSVEFRAFDDGVAYRFITTEKGKIEVLDEDFDLSFGGDYLVHTQFPGGLPYAYEVLFAHVESKQWKYEDDHSVLPVLIDTRKGVKILFSEADLIHGLTAPARSNIEISPICFRPTSTALSSRD